MRALALALAVSGLAACSGAKSIGEACVTDAGLNVGGQGDCDQGLVCQRSDTCSGGCVGICRQLCHADGECPGACKCGETLSTANGGHLVCDGTGC